MKYRNPVSGRVLERPIPDEWLERAGWELLDEEPELGLEADDDTNESEDDR